MRELSRREAIRLTALGVAATAVGGAGLSTTGLPWRERSPVADGGAALPEPEALRSTGGELELELVAGSVPAAIGGRQARLLGYGGSVPGPTLRVRPGDVIRLRLVNRLDQPTNLHVHGLHVSPEGNSDNPFLSIDPGETFDYVLELPADHPPGTFWYHPHRHGLVADQLFAGLYGAIVVEEDDPPAVDRERVLLLADVSLTEDGDVRRASMPDVMSGREGDLLLVNGTLLPRIVAAPGEVERWRVVNACTSRYLRLAADGEFRLLARDVGHEPGAPEIEDVLLPPGARADLLVTMREGETRLRTLGHDRGAPMGMGMGPGGSGRSGELSGPVDIAELVVSGPAVPGGGDLGERLDADPDVGTAVGTTDLRDTEPDRSRTLEFTMGMAGMGRMSVGFDGRSFDPERTDQTVWAGDMEEWTIVNRTPMSHPFHLHVWPMQVVDVGGRTPERPTWLDVVDVPAGSRAVVRIRFGPITGRTVYHCHILDHEDAGMMGVVEVR